MSYSVKYRARIRTIMVDKMNRLKDELERLVPVYGLSHPLVVSCSQELDKVIVELQKQRMCQ
ncbi:MAG: Spo0E family sporulation regulatory protein-aspartic acid phosphatase [Bacillus sp. (in: firmicutes)]